MKTIGIKTIMLLTLAAITAINVNAQTITVKGKVTDSATGTALFACAVNVEGIADGIFTDTAGNYSISVEKGKILVFSYLGYKQQKIKAEQEIINVAMEADNIKLEEVVVTGYHVAKKSSYTGAVANIIANGNRDRNRNRNRDRDVSTNLNFEPYKILQYEYENSEEYSSNEENRFKFAEDNPLSTFSIDVDAASYSNMRRFINHGQMPPKDAVRTEELINYFSYNYPKPSAKEPVKISAEVGECPWNVKHRLVRIGIKAKEISSENLPASNLVFLIDVSGSMAGAERLGLVKSSLKLLINNLRERDRVAIVVYAGSAGEVLPSTSGNDKQKIREALDKLNAGGSTAGGAGISLAYKIARKNFIKGGNNRVILCTDGDFNVGVASVNELENLIETERKSGVFLTVLGYGMGNYKDNKMQILAEKGNGNHAYIDNLQEANKILVNEFGGTIYAVAKDVKLQIEFNPEHVQAYRLVGYESRLLNDEDFNDDTKDAGEMGAGHNVTAFYETVPVGIEFTEAGSIDPLKYQKNNTKKHKIEYTGSNELLTVKLRYKEPDGNKSEKIELPVIDGKTANLSSDFRFASAVAMLGQLLTDSAFKGDSNYEKVITIAKSALDNDEQGYRREFVRLVKTLKGMDNNR
ncbi:MAG: von Willebrand factor type A domain-containing protein [Prevotellaceae bacterium]|jgi:Ca-activated chloride channel family protein|nr:von Willebrand factor type A domain-containing protein [Prevotellaceae bacterium]